MAENQIWFYEVIRIEVGGLPPKILERGFAPRSEATRENARRLLKDCFNDSGYASKHGGLKPEAVRFLDERDHEIEGARYTAVELLTEQTNGLEAGGGDA